MQKIEFNNEYLELIKKLSSISRSIIFKKTDNKICVLRADESKTLYFKVVAPYTYFTFEGDELAIFDFVSFYQSINAFGPSSLVQKDNKIIINYQNGKINYVMSNPRSITIGPKKLGVTPKVNVKLNPASLSEINKSIGYLKAEFVDVIFENGNMMFRIYNKEFGHSFDKPIQCEIIEKDITNFKFTINSSIFHRVPEESYDIQIDNNGYIGFQCSKPNGIDLLIATAKIISVKPETV